MLPKLDVIGIAANRATRPGVMASKVSEVYSPSASRAATAGSWVCRLQRRTRCSKPSAWTPGGIAEREDADAGRAAHQRKSVRDARRAGAEPRARRSAPSAVRSVQPHRQHL